MTVEDDRLALLQLFGSEELQYAGFILTFAVAIFAEISALSYFPHILVWAAALGSASGAFFSLESYLESSSLVELVINEPPPSSSLGATNTLRLLWEHYISKFGEKTKIGRIYTFRMKHK